MKLKYLLRKILNHFELKFTNKKPGVKSLITLIKCSFNHTKLMFNFHISASCAFNYEVINKSLN
jgi:hypothetical protein